MVGSMRTSGKALTVTMEGRASKLLCSVDVSNPSGNTESFIGQWDTGAERSGISENVVDALGLTPFGSVELRTPSGSMWVPTYMVELQLPNRVRIVDYEVMLACLSDDEDVLIGLDVITNGEFAVAYDGEVTQFTFRVPAKGLPDYCDG